MTMPEDRCVCCGAVVPVKRPQADASDIDMLRLADVSEEKI